MDTSKEFSGVAAAARDYFGPRNGDSSAGTFMIEWRELSDADKAEIKAGLEALGYVIKAK